MGKQKNRNQITETPFTDYAEGKISERDFDKITEKAEKSLHKFEKKAELEERFEKLFPEKKDEDFTPKPITDYKASWKEDNKVKFLKERPMEITEYEIKPSQNRRFIMNFSSCKIYYDIEKDAYYLYVFTSDHKKIIKRIPIDKHDILNMLAFALAEIKGEKWIERVMKSENPRLCLSKKLNRKIRGFAHKIELTYFEKHLT